MRLLELFDDHAGPDMTDRLRQAAMDLLTPLAAHKVPFITVDQMLDELQGTRPGIQLDRALVLSLLDPDTVKIVKKIEGDRIYLAMPEQGDKRKQGEDDKERERRKLGKTAQRQAKKELAR